MRRVSHGSHEKNILETYDAYLPRISLPVGRWNAFDVTILQNTRVLSLSLSLSVGNVTTVHHVADAVHESERYFRYELSLMNRNYCAICSAIITRSRLRSHSSIGFHRNTGNLRDLYVDAARENELMRLIYIKTAFKQAIVSSNTILK